MLEILFYNKNIQQIKQIEKDELAQAIENPENLVWIDMEFQADSWPSQEIIDILQNILKIHPLNIEDCVISKQNPKIEQFQEYLFAIAYGIELYEEKIILDEIDLAVGKNFVLTYRHSPIKEIEALKKAFQSKINNMHKSPSMLFHAIIDHLVDNYQFVIDNFDLKIDRTGGSLFKDPSSTQVTVDLNNIKELLSEIRSIVVLEEGMFLNASKGFYSILKEDEGIFFKDVYDHITKILDKIDRQNNTISTLFLAQMNLSTQKLNELVKFLTIVSAILLPANFIAGIFGMNFTKIPLLESPYGFFITISCMFTVAILMMIYFVGKKWL